MKEIKPYIIKELVDENGINHFRVFYENLSSIIAKTKISSRLQRLLQGNLGYYKDLKDGVFELKFSGSGPGYRVYYAKRNNEIIILLIGGDKKTQKKDIKLAKSLWQNAKLNMEKNNGRN